jgi:hypothetical protein
MKPLSSWMHEVKAVSIQVMAKVTRSLENVNAVNYSSRISRVKKRQHEETTGSTARTALLTQLNWIELN